MDRKHDINHLLQTGIRLMSANGYHHTSINEVIKQAGLPKGSFYYLYKDKKAFALDAVKHYVDRLINTMQMHFDQQGQSPLEGLHNYYQQSIRNMEQSNFTEGCFLGNMGQEMADIDEDFRQLISQSFSRIDEALSAQISKAQQAGQIGDTSPALLLAQLASQAWHGALIQMKAHKSSKPLELFMSVFWSLMVPGARR